MVTEPYGFVINNKNRRVLFEQVQYNGDCDVTGWKADRTDYLDGINGEDETPAGYFVDEAEEFDKGFIYKEKLKLPGQLF